MDKRPNTDEVSPIIWKLIRLQILGYLNNKMYVPKWSSCSNYKIRTDTETNPLYHCYSIVIVQRYIYLVFYKWRGIPWHFGMSRLEITSWISLSNLERGLLSFPMLMLGDAMPINWIPKCKNSELITLDTTFN